MTTKSQTQSKGPTPVWRDPWRNWRKTPKMSHRRWTTSPHTSHGNVMRLCGKKTPLQSTSLICIVTVSLLFCHHLLLPTVVLLNEANSLGSNCYDVMHQAMHCWRHANVGGLAHNKIKCNITAAHVKPLWRRRWRRTCHRMRQRMNCMSSTSSR